MDDRIISRLIFTARSKAGAAEYEETSAFGLSARINETDAKSGYVKAEVEISATTDFEGVIRTGMSVGSASPRFYLPGFMYGTNRGEAPLKTDSLTPRLRPDEEFPASPWWMVRGDRLSHPSLWPMLTDE